MTSRQLSRRALLHAVAALPFVPARAGAAQMTVRIGYQRNGALLIMKQQAQLDSVLAALGAAPAWTEFSSGPPMLEAMNANAIDVVATGDMPPIFAQAAGIAFRSVACQPSPGQTTAILVKQDSPIKTLADLRGRRVAFTKGSTAQNLVIRALRHAGLAYTDIKPINLAPADAAAAFRQRAVDAWAIWDPFYALAEREPDTRVLTTAERIASSNSFFLARLPFLQRRPDLVRAVLGETGRISREIESHQAEFARSMAAATGIPEDIQRIAAARGNYQVGYITPAVTAQQQAIADDFHALGLIPDAIAVRDAVWTPET